MNAGDIVVEFEFAGDNFVALKHKFVRLIERPSAFPSNARALAR
jgi:hypothetical protein